MDYRELPAILEAIIARQKLREQTSKSFGFNESFGSNVPQEALYSVINKSPQSVIRGFRGLIPWEKDRDSLGIYGTGFPTIGSSVKAPFYLGIRTKNRPEERTTIDTLGHELGHALQEFLTPEETITLKDEYRRLRQNRRNEVKGSYVTFYSPNEWIAEGYNDYMNNPERFATYPEKIKDLVKTVYFRARYGREVSGPR